MEINNIGNYQLDDADEITELDQSTAGGGNSFSEMLRDSLQDVNNHQQQAKEASRELALGKADNVHDVMIAANKAETTLNLATEVQSKVIDAYEEIMRMQV